MITKFYGYAFYIIILFAAALLLLVGNRIAVQGRVSRSERPGPAIVTARVTEILNQVEDFHTIRPGFEILYVDIAFRAYITGGAMRGQEIVTEHSWVMHVGDSAPVVTVGDRILLIYNAFHGQFLFFDFVRIYQVMLLGVVFFGLILFFGRRKGLTAIIALGFTFASIFFVFIPAILSGRNIYATTFILCTYAILFTLLLVIGPNKKALAATLGCLGGVLFSGLLMLLMNTVLRLTGFSDQSAQQLFALPTPSPINLRAIIFAGVIIGAMGAIMDVAMSIASALWEIQITGGGTNFADFFRSGINIGRDIMGTMLNTLILAYIGSSLTMILLMTDSMLPLMQLLNTEQIVVEVIRALVGSFGMLLTIPLTACICAWLYPSNH